MVLPRTSYTSTATITLGLLLVDLCLNATADNNDSPTAPSFYPFVLLGIQMLIQLLVFLLIFAALSGTYLFQVGLLGVLVQEFRVVLYAIPLYGVCYLSYVGVKISLLVQGQSQDDLWKSPLFIFFSIMQKVAALCYYLVIMRTVFGLGDARWYKRSEWTQRFRSGQAAAA